MRTVEEQVNYLRTLSVEKLEAACKLNADKQLLLDILDLDANSSLADIKKRFRKLAPQIHPDKSIENDLLFKAVSNAYAKLTAAFDPLSVESPSPHYDSNQYRAEWEKQGRELIKDGKGPLPPLTFSLLMPEDQTKLAIFLGIQQDMGYFFEPEIESFIKKAKLAEDAIYHIGMQYLSPEKRASFPLQIEALDYLAQKDKRSLIFLWGMQQENKAFDMTEWGKLIILAKNQFEQYSGDLSEADIIDQKKRLKLILVRTANVSVEACDYLRPQEQKELAILLEKEASGEPFYEERKNDLLRMATQRINLSIADTGRQTIRQNSELHNMFRYLNQEEQSSLAVLFGKKNESKPFDKSIMQELIQRAENQMNKEMLKTGMEMITANKAGISLAEFNCLDQEERDSIAILFGKERNHLDRDDSLMQSLIQKAKRLYIQQAPKLITSAAQHLDPILRNIKNELNTIKFNCDSIAQGIDNIPKVSIESIERRIKDLDTKVVNLGKRLLEIKQQYEQSSEYTTIMTLQEHHKKSISELEDKLKEKIEKIKPAPMQASSVCFFPPVPAAAPQAPVPAAASQAPVPAAASQAPVPAAASQAPVPAAGLSFRKLKKG